MTAGVFATLAGTATLVLATGLGMLGLWGGDALAESGSGAGTRGEMPGQEVTVVADHSVWDQLLQTYVRAGPGGAMCVDYSAVRVPDQTAIDAYVQYLETIPISRAHRDEQLAYWINLYNAFTLQVVLRHYPVDSIRDIDISPGWFASGPWEAKLVTVEERKLSLDDIEDKILRPRWRDPRIHYAINCASAGCPDLAPKAYTAAGLEAQLNHAARVFINHPRGVTVTGDRIRLSGLYKWYRDDFGGDDNAVLDHVRRYATGGLLNSLSGRNRIHEYDYDWSLNDCHARF